MRKAGRVLMAASLPDGSVKGVPVFIAFGLIEIDGVDVGFGHGEGDLTDSLAHEMGSGEGKEHTGKAAAAVVRVDAQLRDVAALRTDPRAEDESGHITQLCV